MQIFDSLAHPTLTGKWLEHRTDSSFSALEKELKNNDYIGAMAVGIDGVEDYSHEKFIQACKSYPALHPVAGFNPAVNDPEKELKRVKEFGFRAIKIHPRFSGIDLERNELPRIFKTAAELELPVMYCTYMHCAAERYTTVDPLYALVGVLKHSPRTKVILVHGGDVEVLKYMELVRFNENLLLDLSLTIMKYEGSSIDTDIKYLFNRFDRRICIGTDFPEYSHADLRRRFESFADGIASGKAENIAYVNIMKHLSLR